MANKETAIQELDIDALIADLESALTKESLAKSDKADMQKDELEDEASSMPAAEGAEAPAADAAPAMDQAPADEAAPAMEQEAAAPESEAPSDEASMDQEAASDQISDEEMDQLYGQMAPEELARHLASIQRAMGQSPAAPEMAKAEDEAEEEHKEKEEKEEEKEMEKSEKISSLEKQIAEQNKQIELITKTLETAFSRPQRKAITSIEYVKKSEDEKPQLSTSEIKDKVSKIAPGALTKSERDVVLSFILSGDKQDDVLKIIESKGGK